MAKGFEYVDDNVPAPVSDAAATPIGEPLPFLVGAGETLDDIVSEIEAWQRETFPKATPASAATHMHREAIEVLQETARVDGFSFDGRPKVAGGYSLSVINGERLGSEVADVFHMLVAICSLSGLNLRDVVRRKFEINKAREWGEPDADGVVEHKQK